MLKPCQNYSGEAFKEIKSPDAQFVLGGLALTWSLSEVNRPLPDCKDLPTQEHGLPK